MIPPDAVGGYTVFGKITGGLEAVQKIAAAGVEGGASDGKPALEAKLGSISLK
jgi:peptidyl-prolyl cis-trans isomerase B (cyclophilin B)